MQRLIFAHGAKIAVNLASAAVLLVWQSGPTAAQGRSVFYPVQAVTLAGGAVLGSTIALPSTGSPSFFMNFVLPSDYLRNGRVDIFFHLQTPSFPCTARFLPVQMQRKRIGASTFNSLEGLTEVGGPTVDFPNTSGFVVAKVARLRRGATFPGQRAGDAFTVQMAREGDDPSDTCASSVFLHGINILYPVAPWVVWLPPCAECSRGHHMTASATARVQIVKPGQTYIGQQGFTYRAGGCG